MKFAILALASTLAATVPATAQTMPPADYVANAGAGDLYERSSSEIVLKTTKNPKIKTFARMMVTDHAKSTAAVKAAAAKSRVAAASPKLTPMQADMIAQLNAAKGSARDATYLTQQRQAHDEALALQQSYATGGTAPALKSAAAKIVPVVQHHIEMLKTM